MTPSQPKVQAEVYATEIPAASPVRSSKSVDLVKLSDDEICSFLKLNPDDLAHRIEELGWSAIAQVIVEQHLSPATLSEISHADIKDLGLQLRDRAQLQQLSSRLQEAQRNLRRTEVLFDVELEYCQPFHRFCPGPLSAMNFRSKRHYLRDYKLVMKVAKELRPFPVDRLTVHRDDIHVTVRSAPNDKKVNYFSFNDDNVSPNTKARPAAYAAKGRDVATKLVTDTIDFTHIQDIDLEEFTAGDWHPSFSQRMCLLIPGMKAVKLPKGKAKIVGPLQRLFGYTVQCPAFADGHIIIKQVHGPNICMAICQDKLPAGLTVKALQMKLRSLKEENDMRERRSGNQVAMH